MRRIVITLVALLFVTCFATDARGQTKAPRLFALDAEALQANKRKLLNKDAALMPAYKQLLKEANSALLYQPVSVVEKKNVPPSGDKHDYTSLAPYFWPDPSKPNGLPYIQKDGQTKINYD